MDLARVGEVGTDDEQEEDMMGIVGVC